MTRKIGTVAKLNGKEVVWAGDDYSWQSRKTFDQLKQQGQLERGSGVVRRIGNLMQQAEDLRHQVFGTDQNLRNVDQKLQQAYDQSILGQAEQGLADLGGKGSQALGLTPALGALAVGMVTPGPGELKALDSLGDATRAARAASRVRVNGQAQRAARAQARDPQAIAKAQTDHGNGKKTRIDMLQFAI